MSFQNTLLLVMELNVKQVLFLESNIAVSKVVTEAKNILVKELTVLESRQWIGSWKVPAQFATGQIFSVHIIHSLVKM